MNKDDRNFPMPEIDRIVHELARLAILTVLSSCEEADFSSWNVPRTLGCEAIRLCSLLVWRKPVSSKLKRGSNTNAP